ncbi:preprotein translocase subunit SecG [Kiloniella antarctica]|uniref:Protein-export membrane protein SecG n=1 Tax=Kiloniella antarctica TaxID=1550907 RepID=A0ABW5BRE0_9PROT
MNEVLLVIHLLITLSLISVVLVQKSEGGGLGMGGSGSGGGSGGFGGFLTGQGTANLLTRTTAILAAAFIASSLLLTVLADTGNTRSIADDIIAPIAPTESEQPVAPPVSE